MEPPRVNRRQEAQLRRRGGVLRERQRGVLVRRMSTPRVRSSGRMATEAPRGARHGFPRGLLALAKRPATAAAKQAATRDGRRLQAIASPAAPLTPAMSRRATRKTRLAVTLVTHERAREEAAANSSCRKIAVAADQLCIAYRRGSGASTLARSRGRSCDTESGPALGAYPAFARTWRSIHS